jgi:hypothetical protein
VPPGPGPGEPQPPNTPEDENDPLWQDYYRKRMDWENRMASMNEDPPPWTGAPAGEGRDGEIRTQPDGSFWRWDGIAWQRVESERQPWQR